MKWKSGSMLFALFIVLLQDAKSSDVQKYIFNMPNVNPKVPELYLCTPVKLNETQSVYIFGFEPNATMSVAHHMLLFGCSKPGSAEPVWNCGEMASSQRQERIANPCKEGSQIIYAWARDAPKLILPEGVGFKVGVDTSIKYLVLQVHYAHIERFKDGSTDDSGVILHYTKAPLNKLAGIILLGTGGSIRPLSTEYMEATCAVEENKVIHPFAYRVHTHSLGKVVSGYVIKNKTNWIELGKKNPMDPQMFYNVSNKIPIEMNDVLAARCTMRNTRTRYTFVGSTNKDEMCNFYLMYYVENNDPLKKKYCFSRGPPDYHWSYIGLQNIPDVAASTL